MANLEALPNELFARIVSFSDRRSLAQLRLTNKRLEDIAVVKLFERVTLYAHWEKQSEKELEESSAHDSGDCYGNDREGYVPRRYSTEQHRRGSLYDAEDGFIADSDEDEEDGFVAGSDHDEEDGFEAGSDQCAEDGFVAGSDQDEEDGVAAEPDLQGQGQGGLNQR